MECYQRGLPDEGIWTLSATFATQEVLKKKVLPSTKSGLSGHIDILTYQYQYVKCRGAHCKDFGASRGTVVFLNNYLSISEVTLIVRKNMVRCTGCFFISAQWQDRWVPNMYDEC